MSNTRLNDVLSGIVVDPGKVTFNGFQVSMDRPLGEQLDALDEDLIQIEFPNQIIVDVGWYPSHSPKGEFQVVLIKSYDWEKPVRLRKSTDANTLRRDVAETIEEAKRLCVR